MSDPLRPRQIRQWNTPLEINDGWYYEEEKGLCLMVELINSDPFGPGRRQVCVGWIPRRQVLAAARRYERAEGGDP